MEIINSRVLSSVYSGLTGNFTIRKKVRGQVIRLENVIIHHYNSQKRHRRDVSGGFHRLDACWSSSCINLI